MRFLSKLLLAVSASSLMLACAKKAEEAPAAAEPEPAARGAAAEPAASDAMIEAARPAPIGSATVTIGLDKNNNNGLYFASAGVGFCNAQGGCGSGITLNTGDVDLSNFPAGDVTVTLTIDDDAANAGYRFPAAPFEAIGIAIWPTGATTEPPDFTPMFGANAWPRSDFQPPSVSGDKRSVTFLDEESAEDAYQYAVAVDGPSGRTVLDPKITNGGHGR